MKDMYILMCICDKWRRGCLRPPLPKILDPPLVVRCSKDDVVVGWCHVVSNNRKVSHGTENKTKTATGHRVTRSTNCTMRPRTLQAEAQIPLGTSHNDVAYEFLHSKKSWRALSRLSGSTARHAWQAWHARHVVCVVSWRNATSEFGLRG